MLCKPFIMKTTDDLNQRTAALLNSSELKDNVKEVLREYQQQLCEMTTENESLRESHRLLNHSQQRYASLYDFAPACHFTLNHSYRIEELNRAAAQLLGQTKEALLEQNFAQWVAPKYKDTFAAHIATTLDNEGIHTCEIEIETTTQQVYRIQLQSSRFFYQNNGQFHCRTAAIDITELKQTTYALKKKTAHLQSIIETVGEGISVSNINGYFEIFNQRLEEITGYTKEEANSYDFFLARLYPNYDNLEAAAFGMAQLLEKGGSHGIETEIVTKTGERKTLLVSTVLVQFNSSEYFLSVYHDITHRKVAEEALRRSENELRELNATKDKLLSIIAHDLRNPFTTLIGFSETLVDDFDEMDEQDIKHFLRLIRDSANKGHGLLENLLHWSRSQLGRISVTPETIRVKDIVAENIELLSDTASKKTIEITDHTQPQHCLSADANMLTTVVRNLLSNAIKFTPPGGKITIESHETDQMIDVSVSDTGVGMNAETLQKLFKLNEIHTTKGTAQEGGTGLGLVLCKEFIDKNNGFIWAESQENEGSRFSFALPKVKNKPA